MGLDVSHGAFSGSYSAFNRFRQVIARAIGGSYPPHTFSGLDEDRWYWAKPSDADRFPGLKEFFDHSDCDGEIEPAIAALIADEMEALLPVIDQFGTGAGHIERGGGYGNVTRRFIKGCREAQRANESLEFG